jgi:ABC-type branched-subunit amino acid transport system substrate-binding protein
MTRWALRPIPDPDSPVGQLAQCLRKLADTADVDSLRAFARLTHCGPTTISDALSGKPHLVPTTTIIETICNVCHADQSTRARLRVMRAEAIKSKSSSPAPLDPSPPDPPSLDPSPSDTANRHKRRQAALSLVLIASIVGGLVWFLGGSSDEWCQGPGVQRSGQFNECVGVTDGTTTFAPNLGLRTVMKRIKQENDAVVANGAPFVSIGYVVPLPHDVTNEGLLTGLRRELEGVYLAQLRANHRDGLGDIPLIRVLVANVGDQSNQQSTVIPEVIRRVGDPADHLVAVAGLGQSREATARAIQTLSEAGIPMIASRLTADGLSTSTRGLFRISPTTKAQAAAAAHALKSEATLLVQDINPNDLYTESLAAQFQAVFTTSSAGKLLEPERYDSSLPAVGNTFMQMMYNICIKQPAAIYYAGRDANLPSFLSTLTERPCPQQKIDLFTGSNAVDLAATLRQQLAARNQNGIAATLRANISLHYTGLAHPGEWADQQRFLPASTRIFQQNCATCFTQIFPQEQLDDGAAIMGYDALLVATRAIRSGISQQDNAPVDPAAITPGALLQQMYRINDAAPVNGASGSIAFDEQGKPLDKPFPILQLNPDGTVTFTRLA